VPKITINNTTHLFFNCNQHFSNFKPQQFPSAVWLNRSRIFYIRNIFIFWHWKWPAHGTSTVPVVSAHFRSVGLHSPIIIDLVILTLWHASQLHCIESERARERALLYPRSLVLYAAVASKRAFPNVWLSHHSLLHDRQTLAYTRRWRSQWVASTCGGRWGKMAPRVAVAGKNGTISDFSREKKLS